jgi:hypothetical protein
MKPKGLLIGLALLAVMGGLVFWSSKTYKGADTKETPVKILSIPQDQFREIKLENIAGQVIDLKRDDAGQWRMTAPLQMTADQDAVAAIVSTLADLNAEKVVEEEKSTDLMPFGLRVPSVKATVITKDGKKRELLMGTSTLDTSSNYAKLAGDGRVFTIPSSSKLALDRRPEELRDKRLLTFEPDSVSRVTLQTKGAEIEFGKSGQNDWQILKPRPLRADNTQVSALVDALRDARLDPIELEQDAQKKFPAATHVATAIVTDRNGAQAIELRKDMDGVYAKSPAGIWKAADSLAVALNKSLDDFRDKKVYTFGFNDPNKVELRSAAYAKSGDKWTSNGKTMDGAAVQSLIDKLRALTATKFAPSGGSAPAFEAAVTWEDGKRSERVSIAKQGSQYFAKRENDPVIYEVDPKAVEELQSAAAGIKEAAPEAKKK